jgi:hypothetical protein
MTGRVKWGADVGPRKSDISFEEEGSATHKMIKSVLVCVAAGAVGASAFQPSTAAPRAQAPGEQAHVRAGGRARLVLGLLARARASGRYEGGVQAHTAACAEPLQVAEHCSAAACMHRCCAAEMEWPDAAAGGNHRSLARL